jgi:tetratricopeptide (TPR) repeat protein
MHIGKVRETLGDIPMALEAYQAAASVSHEAGSKSDEGVADLRIGTLRFNSHAWQEALNAYSEAEKLFETVGDRQNEASALQARAELAPPWANTKENLIVRYSS